MTRGERIAALILLAAVGGLMTVACVGIVFGRIEVVQTAFGAALALIFAAVAVVAVREIVNL